MLSAAHIFMTMGRDRSLRGPLTFSTDVLGNWYSVLR